jgi:hypothetical protein
VRPMSCAESEAKRAAVLSTGGQATDQPSGAAIASGPPSVPTEAGSGSELFNGEAEGPRESRPSLSRGVDRVSPSELPTCRDHRLAATVLPTAPPSASPGSCRLWTEPPALVRVPESVSGTCFPCYAEAADA